MEIWKDVKGFEGWYQVSNLGQVRSVERDIVHKCGKVQRNKSVIKKIQLNNMGYQQMQLFKNSKHFKRYVHRMVAESFIPNPNDLPYVNHIDYNPLNNNVSNLEWVDPKGNYDHSLDRQNKAKFKAVKRIDPNTNETIVYESMKEAKIKNGFPNDMGIRDVCQGKRYLHKGYHWEFVH